MIVAMGTIMSDGSIVQGYNVDNVTWTGNWYEIALTGTDYHYLNYVTLATLIYAGAGETIEVGSDSSGHLTVHISAGTADPFQDRFYFMVLDPTP
jgi:hypothetical protein